MIAKQIKGRSFRGVLNYLSSKAGAQHIGGNMVGKTPQQLSAEFACSQGLNPKLGKAVYHVSLSVPAEETQSEKIWKAIAKDYLTGMGFKDCQHVVYRHTDTGHDHIHVVASRTRFTDGSTVSDSWDYARSEKLVRELEKAYKLEPVVPKHSGDRSQTTGEFRQLQRTGEKSVREQLKQALKEAAADNPTMPQFVKRLLGAGVAVKASHDSVNNRIRGISYALDDVAFSGSHLGRDYTFPGLQKHKSISYDAARDDSVIAALIAQGPQLRQSDDSAAEFPVQESDHSSESHQPDAVSVPVIPVEAASPITSADEPDEGEASATMARPMEIPMEPIAVQIRQSADFSTELEFFAAQPTAQPEIDPLQRRCAEAIAPVAITFLKFMQQQGELEQVGEERWRYQGKHYAMAYDKAEGCFSIEALDGRGELLRFQDTGTKDSLVLAQGIGNGDIDSFHRMEQILNQQGRQQQIDQQRQRQQFELE